MSFTSCNAYCIIFRSPYLHTDNTIAKYLSIMSEGTAGKIRINVEKQQLWEWKTSKEWRQKSTHFILTPTTITHKSYFHTVCTSLLGILYQVKEAPYIETMPVCPSVSNIVSATTLVVKFSWNSVLEVLTRSSSSSMFNENRHTERHTLLNDNNEMLPVISTFFKQFI